MLYNSILIIVFILLFIASIKDLKTKTVPLYLLVLPFVLSLFISNNIMFQFSVIGVIYFIRLTAEMFTDEEILGEADISIFGTVSSFLSMNVFLSSFLIYTSLIALVFYLYYKVVRKEHIIPLFPSIFLASILCFIIQSIS